MRPTYAQLQQREKDLLAELEPIIGIIARIELNSPRTKSCEICLARRSVQSQAKILGSLVPTQPDT